MRTKIFALLIFIMAGSTALLAGEKNLKLKVFGNCGMCENRIEKAANSVDGVTEASWDKGTQMLTVSLADNADAMAVHKAVAEAGHDTEKVKAAKTKYADLPGCCKYDRPAKGDKSNCKKKGDKKKCCDKS